MFIGRFRIGSNEKAIPEFIERRLRPTQSATIKVAVPFWVMVEPLKAAHMATSQDIKYIASMKVPGIWFNMDIVVLLCFFKLGVSVVYPRLADDG